MPCVKSLVATVAFACLASAETIKVTATSKNTFDPDTITAKQGDVVEFHFEPKNHSVTAGNYQWPCTPLNMDDKSTFFSAFIPDKVFRVTINETSPTVFYSSQGDECSKGMVGIINQSANVTLNDYKKRASELSQGVSPRNQPFGGEFADNKAGSSSSETGSSAKPTSSSGSSGGKNDGDHSNAAASSSLGAPMTGLLGVAFLAAWAGQA